MTKQEQKDNLFQNYFNRYVKKSVDGKQDITNLELIITSYCNQKCEYCYLKNFGDKMYPPESNKEENILRNLPLLLRYLHYDQNMVWEVYDIFSGEFFMIGYWEKVFEIIYDFQMEINNPHRVITIPSNMSWITDSDKMERVEHWIHKFQKVNIMLHISASVDGPQELESVSRALRNEETKLPEFYDILFKFMSKYNYGAHPMIGKYFLSNYKANYDFWDKNLIKYNCMVPNKKGNMRVNISMFLEIRNEEQWDKESLKNYRDFLWYAAEHDLQTLHNGDLEDFAYRIFDDFSASLESIGNYNRSQPYFLGYPGPHKDIPCSIQNSLKIRVGDLAWVPCHRTAYESMLYGYFVLNEEKTKIIGLHGEHVELAYKIKMFNANRSSGQCAACPIKHFCAKGCLGAQFETNRELFSTIDSVCDMYFVKYITIHEIVKHYNLYDFILNSPYVSQERKDFINYARQILNGLESTERYEIISSM